MVELEPRFSRLYIDEVFSFAHFALCDRKRSEMRNYSVVCEVTLGVCACMHWAEHGGENVCVWGVCVW